jgi:hypothetical protein
MTTRVYRGSLEAATLAFQRDQGPMKQGQWYPTSQTYQPGSWSAGAFILALVLCLLLVGFLVFIYLVVVKPPGTLVVTYEYRGEGQPSAPPFDPYGKAPAGYLCGRCGKNLSPAWVAKCQHCGVRYAEALPVLGT